jgi:hypothetical protein
MRLPLMTLAAGAALALVGCSDPSSPEGDGQGTVAANSGDDALPSPDAAHGSTAPVGSMSNTAAQEARTEAAAPARASRVESADDECGASKVAAYIAQEATTAVRARLAADVGHDRIRWVGPDTAVTMDFRPDRLNVSLDSANVITGGKCS